MLGKLFGQSNSIDFEKPILTFPGYNNAPWRLSDAVKGTQIFGATGSGKSSGSGKEIAKSFLKAGYGGLVLCAKPDERETWERYAELTGRTNDLVVFSPDTNFSFNPLAYENSRDGGGETLNLVELMMRLQELSDNFSAQSAGGQDEKFWINALKRYISRIFDLLQLAKQEVSFQNMFEVMMSSGVQSMGDYSNFIEDLNALERLEQDALANDDSEAKEEAKEISQDLDNDYDILISSSFCIYCLERAKAYEQNSVGRSQKLLITEKYFTQELLSIPSKTRAIIEEYFRGLVEPFLGGMLNEHFARGTDPALYPEITYRENKIVILDFPVKKHLLAGVLSQGIYKYLWQQALERRNTEEYPDPVFLWVDESQYFVNPVHDTLFQTTARSARVCTVYLTQNINNYYFVMGANQAQARAKSLIANLSTLIFHANTDFETNDWASKTIGQGYYEKVTKTKNHKDEISENTTHVKDFHVPTSLFTKLSTGGKTREVEAIIVVNGKKWGGRNPSYIRTTFIQDKRK